MKLKRKLHNELNGIERRFYVLNLGQWFYMVIWDWGSLIWQLIFFADNHNSFDSSFSLQALMDPIQPIGGFNMRFVCNM